MKLIRMPKAFIRLLLFSCCVTSTLLAQTPREVARYASGSVVVLIARNAKGKAIALGSGFFVSNDVIATNSHVIKGAVRLYIKFIGQRETYRISETLAVDQKEDVALLRVAGVKANPLQLGISEAVGVGDEIYAIGNPEGLEGTFSQGLVSSIRLLGGRWLLQITAPISPGSSGGPILNKQGQVIGIAAAFLRQGQNLNFAVPISALVQLIDRSVESNQTRDVTDESIPDTKISAKRLFIDGGLLAQGLHYEEAIKVFQQAIRLKPDYAEAYCELGAAYNAVKRYADALNALQNAIRINPNLTVVYGYLGRAYCDLKRYAEAIETYKQGLRLKPDDYSLNAGLGDSLLKSGRYKEALAIYQIALNLADSDFLKSLIQFDIGETYYSLALYEQAIAAYKEAFRLDDSSLNKILHRKLGLTYLALGNKRVALNEYEVLVQESQNEKIPVKMRELLAEAARELFAAINK